MWATSLFKRFRITSLRAKIDLVFSIAMILLIFLFAVLWKRSVDRSFAEIQMQERANIHYLYLYYLKYGTIDRDYLASQNIRVVDVGGKNLKLYKEIVKKGKKKDFAVANIRLHRYILINNDRFKLILENLNKPRFPVELALAFAGALALLILLYFWMIRSIQPLSELREKILRFSEGDLDIHCHSDREDEIAAVANAFDQAVGRIRDLMRSRQLLLRAIMHELKTPIAKGRLLSEMIDDPKRKARFHAIFERLNLLIDEFAKVEQITSRNFQPDFHRYKASDILEGSIDLLMLDDPAKYLHTVIAKDFTLQADFELLTLALKNLIDNAVKYSPDRHADILIKAPTIVVSNRGKPLPHPLEEYFTPFHASEGGLGLGLYIIKSILDLHGMDLRYRHEKGENYFEIVIKNEE
ncbi:integral membrane sensor signal transduction histidine kinase [Nitratifractor salsuginis DSM 16511]|uniref:histidine kinase n=1 Tax=Nitratifractor salsuginis (strain DSM 16511 / JCM 12458 / E9I37-1) TaxID=749222 RepID=E6X100_NITSE|nr:integral membrane sensor signal transduction histidine kinase [Nitratifractor salsuginis DSM 16511]